MDSLEIKNTEKKGKGLYTTIHFDKNQVILPFKGKIINKNELNGLPQNKIDLLLQIDNTKYLDLEGNISFYINHSCNPNTSVKILSTQAFLIATRSIKPGEELLFDYSVTSNDTPETWSMKCKCGEWNCRKTISGFGTLSDKEKIQHINKGIVPKYIK